MKPHASVLWFPGTNCHREMMRAFEVAGARTTLVLLNSLLEGKRRLTESDLIGIPGGFSFGDHFGAGRVAAYDLTQRLLDQLLELKSRRVPILGICNGFQILVAAGLLPGDGPVGTPTAVMDFNQTARFEHWYTTKVFLHQPARASCVWTDGLDGVLVRMPSAHGEGRPYSSTPLSRVIGTYGSYEGNEEYPDSPNGSAIAGICDPSGAIAGFMPHPERRIDELRGGSDGNRIFYAGVRAVQ